MSDGLDFPGYASSPQTVALRIESFDAAAGQWREPVSVAASEPAQRIVVATWNAWFQGPDAARRQDGLLAVLASAHPHLIALQEVTTALLERIREAAWVRDGYQVAHAPIRADAIPSHGLALLSRLPLAATVLHPLPTHMGRRALVASWQAKPRLAIAVVHLESMKANADTRGEQLRTLFGLLEDETDALVAGDFNFCASWPEENDRLDRRYRDLWAVLRAAEAGYTQDTGINTMLARAKQETRQVRIDRILLRSDTGRWIPESIRLIGDESIDGDAKLYPSDHFGLVATLVREK